MDQSRTPWPQVTRHADDQTDRERSERLRDFLLAFGAAHYSDRVAAWRQDRRTASAKN